MSGTLAGGAKAAATNKKKYGNDFYKRIGRMGGSAQVPKGFALNRERAVSAGRKGGTISKRGPANVLNYTQIDTEEPLFVKKPNMAGRILSRFHLLNVHDLGGKDGKV